MNERPQRRPAGGRKRKEEDHRLNELMTLPASRRRLLLRAVLGAVVAFVSRALRPFYVGFVANLSVCSRVSQGRSQARGRRREE